LYYFVPRKDGRARVWLTQASLSLVTLGGVCAVALYAARFAVARQFANPGLADFGLQMALITWLMIASAPLEISLTAEGRVRTAAMIIFLSDAVRVVASVVPLLLGMGLQGFFWAYVLHGGVRFALQCWFFFRRGRPRIEWDLFREQLAYALPFGAALLLEIAQRTFHQWAVGWSVDAAAFAIYAQGCFQVPIINLLYAPISDILQVRLAEPGAPAHRVHLFPRVRAISGHAIAESPIRVAMLDRVRRELEVSWTEVLPWRQLSVIGVPSLVACAPATLISQMAAESPRPFLALCAAGALY